MRGVCPRYVGTHVERRTFRLLGSSPFVHLWGSPAGFCHFRPSRFSADWRRQCIPVRQNDAASFNVPHRCCEMKATSGRCLFGGSLEKPSLVEQPARHVLLDCRCTERNAGKSPVQPSLPLCISATEPGPKTKRLRKAELAFVAASSQVAPWQSAPVNHPSIRRFGSHAELAGACGSLIVFCCQRLQQAASIPCTSQGAGMPQQAAARARFLTREPDAWS